MNDSRTDAHKKVFTLAPVEADLGTLILGARDEVVEDNSLSLGARLMFVRILDLSVRQASNVRPGVVTISQTKLAEKFGVSLRTIWNWKWELLERRVIWMTSQPMPNAWPIDTYHVTAIHPPHNSGDKTSVEGLWGNGARQRRPDQVGMGARQPGQVQIPGTGVRRNQLRLATGFQVSQKSSILPAIAAQARNPLPASAETGCGGEPKQVATEARNQLRRGAETSCEPPPKQVAAGSRNRLRAAAEASCEHKKAQGEGSSHSEGGRSVPAPHDEAFERWSKSLDGQFPSHLRALERKIKARLETVRSQAAREGLKRQLREVQARILPPVEDAPVKASTATASTATTKAKAAFKPLTKEFMEKAKKEAGLV